MAGLQCLFISTILASIYPGRKLVPCSKPGETEMQVDVPDGAAVHSSGTALGSWSKMTAVPGRGEENLISVAENAAMEAEISSNGIVENYKKLFKLRNVIPEEELAQICQRDSVNSADMYAYEFHRRQSFRGKWRKADIIDPGELAANGFIFIGPDDTVQCHYCKVVISDWPRDRSAFKGHMEASPNCQFLQGQISVKNIPDILSWIIDDGSSSNNTNISSELGIITEHSKYPEMAVESRRMDSFLTWPTANKFKADDFANTGLFYEGTGDTVCCYTCGVEMKDFKRNEDLWVRHARQSPQCQFLLREKGDQYIQTVLNENGRYVQPEKDQLINNVSVRMVRPRYDTEEVQRVIALGFSPDTIRTCITELLKYGLPDFTSCVQVVVKYLDMKPIQITKYAEETITLPVIISPPKDMAAERETARRKHQAERKADKKKTPKETTNKPSSSSVEPRSGRDIVETAKTLKLQITCKICMDAPVGIIFLPCGHLVCCAGCASAMQDCPMCRLGIKGRVITEMKRLKAKTSVKKFASV